MTAKIRIQIHGEDSKGTLLGQIVAREVLRRVPEAAREISFIPSATNAGNRKLLEQVKKYPQITRSRVEHAY